MIDKYIYEIYQRGRVSRVADTDTHLKSLTSSLGGWIMRYYDDYDDDEAYSIYHFYGKNDEYFTPCGWGG